jgi:hypothetical protein
VPALDWLTAQPVAHRGLHDRTRGIIENMPGAALAAIAGISASSAISSSRPTARPVRTQEQRELAARYADQKIFEGFWP